MRLKSEGDVCCRNLRQMYQFFLVKLKWKKSEVDELFVRSLPTGMTLAEALDTENWIEHRVYDKIVRTLVLDNLHDRWLLYKMGSSSSECEPIGDLIKKFRMSVFMLGFSLHNVYGKLVPMVVPWYNKTKEFIPVEMRPDGCTYMIRMFQLVDPLNDWTSDWWIRGILAEPTTMFKLKPAVVRPRILPFDIVRLLTEEFSELDLEVKMSGNELLVNGEVCGQRIYLQQDMISETGVRYFSGNWTKEKPDGIAFEGIRITHVLPAMKNEAFCWQAVNEGEIYVPYAEFDRHQENPYFVLDITWGKIPWFLRALFLVLKIFSVFGVFWTARRKDIQDLNVKISQMNERLANREVALRDATVELRRVSDERAEALGVIQEQHARLRMQEERIRTLFEQLHPSKRMAQIVIDKGALQPQRQQASILYVDIVGSTAATEKLGPEAWMNYVCQFYDTCERVVIESGGGAYQRIGDEVVGIWIRGLTSDKEINCADAALMAAISMRYALKDSFPYQIRIGIATGTIIVGSVGSEKTSIQCFGRSMNEGARFNGQAEPGKIVFEQETFEALSETTRALYCKDSVMTVRHNVQLKGVSSGRTLYSL